MNRYDFSKAQVARALSGQNVPNFMKNFDFKKKAGKLYLDGRVVIPTEERDAYLRKALYENKSTLPMGRDSLFHILKKKVINVRNYICIRNYKGNFSIIEII